MDFKKFVADLTARYRKPTEPTPAVDFDAVHEAGRRSGYEAGHAEGYEAGRNDWYDAGYNKGYDEGFQKGLEAKTPPPEAPPPEPLPPKLEP